MARTTIIQILKKDHEEVEALCERAKNSKDETRRSEIFAKINDALTTHTAFEEERIYPVLESQKSTRDDTLEAIEEHALVKHLLAEISGTTPGHEHWKAKITVLAENVKHHVKEEEQKGGLFDELKEALDEEELFRLGEEYLASKLAAK